MKYAGIMGCVAKWMVLALGLAGCAREVTETVEAIAPLLVPDRQSLQFGPEFGTDFGPLAAAPGAQRQPSASTGDDHHLVVWLDARDGLGVVIFGTRIAMDGRALDPGGIVIARARGASAAATAWDGQNHMVVWSDTEPSPSTRSVIFARPVSPAGVPLGTEPIVVSSGEGMDVVGLDVAWNGTHHLVGWMARRFSPERSEVFVMRLDRAGKPLDPQPIKLSSGDIGWYTLHIAGGADQHLVTWAGYATRGNFDTSDVMAARVSGEGKALDNPERAVVSATGPQRPASAHWDGSKFLIGFYETGGPTWRLRALRLDAGGTVLDPAGFDVVPAGRSYRQSALGVSGTRAFAVWRELGGVSQVWLGQVALDGSGPTDQPIPLVTTAVEPALEQIKVTSGAQGLVLWTDKPTGQFEDVVGARFDPSGKAVDTMPVTLSTAARAQVEAVIAAGDREFLLVWLDEVLPNQRVVQAMRLTADGAIVAPGRMVLSDGFQALSNVAVAWNGKDWLVAWREPGEGALPSGGIRTRVVSAAGERGPLPPAVLAGTANLGDVQMASDGNGYLLVGTSPSLSSDIRGLRLGADGTAVGEPLVISAETMAQLRPSVAWNGTGYLVAWEDRRHGPASVYAARVTQQGGVMDPLGIPVARTSQHEMPSVAWNGTHHLVVWREPRGAASSLLRARRLRPDGSMDGEPIAIADPIGSIAVPKLTVLQGRFVVGWQETRTPPASILFMSRIDSDGTVMDPGGVPAIASDGNGAQASAPIFGALNSTGVVAHRFFWRPEGVVRIRARVFRSEAGPPADAAVDPADAALAPPETAPDAAVDREPEASSADASAPAPNAGSAGCSCRTGGGTPLGPLGLLVPLLLLALRRRHFKRYAALSSTPPS